MADCLNASSLNNNLLLVFEQHTIDESFPLNLIEFFMVLASTLICYDFENNEWGVSNMDPVIKLSKQQLAYVK